MLLFIPFRNPSYTTIRLGIRCPRYWIRFLCSLVSIRSIDMEPVAYVKVECYECGTTKRFFNRHVKTLILTELTEATLDKKLSQRFKQFLTQSLVSPTTKLQ